MKSKSGETAAFTNIRSDLFGEIVLAYAAECAFKIFGKIFKFCAGFDTEFGSAEFFVVYPAANVTYIFFHN